MKAGGRICIIPARGGSKRIPRKNLRPFCGLPMLAHPIRCAVESGIFDRVVVSTDDAEIAAVSREYGAEVPFLRSPETSGDFTGLLDVLRETIMRLREETGAIFELGCCLYATAVLASAPRLREGLTRALAEPELDYVVTVTPLGVPVERTLRERDGRLEMVAPEHFSTRSQDLPPAYRDAAQWYWFHPERLADARPVLGPWAGAVILPEWEAQDIDTEEDLVMAELKFNYARRNPRA